MRAVRKKRVGGKRSAKLHGMPEKEKRGKGAKEGAGRGREFWHGVIAEAPPAIDRDCRSIRLLHSKGHPYSCHCSPCLTLRKRLQDHLFLAYHYPLRYGIEGERCEHGEPLQVDCTQCTSRWERAGGAAVDAYK